MGKSLQVRGTIQKVELRTLNAEISEILKEDIDEVDFQCSKELTIDSSTPDLEVNFLDGGISKAKFLFLRADNPITIKINSSVNAGFATTLLMNFGEIEKLFLTATVGTKVKVIAMA